MAEWFFYVAVVVAVVLLLWISKAVIIVGGRQVGIMERKYFGRRLAAGRVIAMPGEIGVQARTLAPGFHFLFPFMFRVQKDDFVTVGQKEIGFIESIDGEPIASGRILGRSVSGHDFFQSGADFLRSGGEKGPQVDIIPPGTYRINTAMFRVEVGHAAIIPQGGIGTVNAMDGQPMDRGRLLAKYVEGHNNFQNGQGFLAAGGQKGPQLDILLPGTYRINPLLFSVSTLQATVVEAGSVGLVTARDGAELPGTELVAKSVGGHDSFQDAAAFLQNGGQRGPQLDVLPPGTYYINPLMFTVQLDSATVVEQGQVAVIISNVGAAPGASVAVGDIAADTGKVERYVVPKGFRGIQSEVLGPGSYYINNRAYHTVIVNTTNITIDWDETDTTAFDPLQVISKDGFNLRVGVKVVIRVEPEQAPFMVARIGNVENLISNVIHPLIDSSFRNQASSTQAMDFLQDRHEQQDRAYVKIQQELSRYYVEVLSVLICEITLPESLMETQTKKVLAGQRQSMYDEEQKAEQKRIAVERTRAQADKQKDLVSAEIDVQVALQNKQKTITLAEGTSEKLRLEGTGEASKILQVGKATAQAYDLTSKSIGPNGLTVIELMKLISTGSIKITPDILMSGQGEPGSVMNLMLLDMLKSDRGKKEAVAGQDHPAS